MATDYAFIRAYGKYTGARESFVDDTVRRARRQNAADDVMIYHEDSASWTRFGDLEAKAEGGDAEAAEQVKKIREIMR